MQPDPTSPLPDFVARFWAKVDRRGDSECWPWLAAVDRNGYGAFFRGGYRLAHRASYEINVGKIPGRLTIDHLCKNKICVNPRHFEVVTRGENSRRAGGLAVILATRRAATHCKRGHEFTEANTYIDPTRGRRSCVTCRRAGSRAWHEKRAA